MNALPARTPQDSSVELVVIPRDPTVLSPTLAGTAGEAFAKKRGELFHAIGSGGEILSAVTKLKEGPLYRVVLPSGHILHQGADGSHTALVFENGRIKTHARFDSISPSVMDFAKVLGTQCLLLKISMQLGQIEGKIDLLLQKGRNDRMAEILAGIEHYKSAIHCDQDVGRSLLIQAIDSLRGGISKCQLDLKHEIEGLPEVPRHWWQSLTRQLAPWSSIQKDIHKKVEPAFELASAIAIGTEYLSASYIQLGQIGEAKRVFRDSAQNIQACNPQRLANALRQLPMAREETVWKPFETIGRANASLLTLESSQQPVIHLEFQKSDIPI